MFSEGLSFCAKCNTFGHTLAVCRGKGTDMENNKIQQHSQNEWQVIGDKRRPQKDVTLHNHGEKWISRDNKGNQVITYQRWDQKKLVQDPKSTNSKEKQDNPIVSIQV